MKYPKDKICAFVGQKNICYKSEVKNKLYKFVESLINSGFNNFLIWQEGEFDNLVLCICRDLMDKYKFIKINVISSSNKNLNKEKYSVVNLSYSMTDSILYTMDRAILEYLKKVDKENIIKLSDFIIFYLDIKDKRNVLRHLLTYAIKKKKKFINIYNNKKSSQN